MFTQLNLVTNPQYLGKVRRSEALVLGSTTWLNNTLTYDTWGRVTNTAGNNLLNPTVNTAEQMAYTYDWADNKMSETRTHTPGAAGATGTRNLNYTWQYDHAGRQINYLFTLDGDATHLAEYNYNHRNELVERNLHSNLNAGLWGWLQSVDYTYNELGWLTQINDNTSGGITTPFPTSGCTPALPNPGTPARVRFPESNDLFYLELRYDQLFSSTSGGISSMTGTAQKSGNISQLAWRTRGRDRQAYSFTYDALSRLTAADYYDVGTTGTATASNNFKEALTYDLRGNILSLNRNGYYQSGTTCGFGNIDLLTYSYVANNNRLQSITDGAATTQRSRGFNPGVGTGSYSYDANGNLSTDPYKGITSIVYNYMNLPKMINFGSNSIELIYDAGGQKLRKIVRSGATVQYEQDYLSGIEYRRVGTGDRRIEAIYHGEGRYYNLNVEVNNTPSWRKEYALRDHLGNTRLMFSDKNNNGSVEVTNSAATNEVLQENHYYPFGMTHEGAWAMNDAARDSRYQYNNKELNDDWGLNLYAYGARWYDPAIGRFTGVDPISEEFPFVSTFNYAENEPIANIDLHGLQKFSVKELGVKGLVFFVGAVNAITSNVLGGAGRGNPEDFGANASDARAGLAIGDAISVVGGLGTAALSAAAVGVEGVLAPETGGATVLAVPETAALGLAGLQTAATGFGNLVKASGGDKGDKQHGSYTTSHESGKKYHGKGPEERMKESGKEKSKKYNDPVVNEDWKPSANERESFKDEARRLKEDGGHRNPNNYNKRDSPGTKYIKEDEK